MTVCKQSLENVQGSVLHVYLCSYLKKRNWTPKLIRGIYDISKSPPNKHNPFYIQNVSLNSSFLHDVASFKHVQLLQGTKDVCFIQLLAAEKLK